MNTYTVVYRDEFNSASICEIQADSEQGAREQFVLEYGNLSIDFINLNIPE